MSVELSAKVPESNEKFWRVSANSLGFTRGFISFVCVLNRVYRPCPSVVEKMVDGSGVDG